MHQKARSYRLIHLPDLKVGQVSKMQYNPLLRRGWYKVGVCDRAVVILEAIAKGSSELDRMQAITHLVGTLDLTSEQDLLDEGFPQEVVLGTRIVQGHAFDTPHSYFAALSNGFEWMKLPKVVLHLAEREELKDAIGNPRRNKVFGDSDAVRRLLLTCSSDAAEKLLRLLEFQGSQT